jgi:hypothetical protein
MGGDFETEVAQRVGRPFDEVRSQLEEFFDMEWDEVLVVIETSATKRDIGRADVIKDLIERSERKPSAQTRIKRSMVRWIGKPWRERDNPWDRFKDRVPPVKPPPDAKSADLDEWTPLKPDDD